MPYEDLYRAHALTGSLFQTVPIRKAAFLIALDNDVRDQSEIDADLPNNGDFAHWWMASELEPSGKLKASRDKFERALLKSVETGRLSAAIVARNIDDEIDPIYTIVPINDIRDWCLERDVDTGDWIAHHEETEIEFSDAIIDEIATHYSPGTAALGTYDAAALETYRSSDESERADQYRRLLQEVQKLRSETSQGIKAEPDGPINTREKNSLLTVIGALITALSDRLPEGYKRAQAVASLTDRIGASLSVNTVDKILKQIDAAVDRRRGANR
ncbi:hypothetical protein [Paraburkholderia sp. BL25I1N1]|uniref:hypothetical protein n=1 Tax=Paraburkholderia sp. BL25I1N1 TaxID=1938804 RepID=UPI000D063FEF|nr:hypothetical protein [Paraburkholderia sp. BL25I1N1]PRY07047.1 hypothetical protein B0G73_105189 [Paraburkholderia sp. BL25I1N1]